MVDQPVQPETESNVVVLNDKLSPNEVGEALEEISKAVEDYNFKKDVEEDHTRWQM